MADLLRWFKVWATILDDPHFQELSLEQIGRWVLLGAMTASVGTRGKLVVVGSGRRLYELLRVRDLDAAKQAISGLPNLTFEEVKNRHGELVVTWKNWTKFQRDSTQAQRAKASRSKRRGEERREEESIPLRTSDNGNGHRRAPGPGPHQALLAEYDRLFAEKFSVRPKIVGGRDGAILKELLRDRPCEEILELLRGFFKTGTRFSRERGAYTLPVFKSQYNDLLVMKQRGEL